MRITDFAKGASWAIVPERFEALASAARDLTPEKLNQTLIKIGAGRDERTLYTIADDGIAVIDINGPLAKNIDWFDRLVLGMSDYADIQSAMREAMDDDRVNGIVLNIDSPGGTVNGLEETAAAIFGMRSEKPIAAFSSGMMTSAAYRIGSAAARVFAGKTADLGSIGVLLIHTDFSRLEERIGIKTTYLTAGKYKALGNPSEPLSDTARVEFQGWLDQLYTEFVETVSLYRDVETERALAMADGRIYIGERAVGVGLADEIGSLQSAIEWVSNQTEFAENDKSTLGGFRMSKEKIEVKSYDDLKTIGGDVLKQAEAAAFETGVKSVDVNAGAEAARAEERERLIGLAAAFMGEEKGAQFADIVKSGVTVDQFKAISQIGKTAQPDPKKSEMLEAIENAGAENPGPGGGDIGAEDYWSLVAQVRREKGCSNYEAQKEVTRRFPKAREKMLQEANPKIQIAK